ncbi:hypothetical protein AN639_01390 [Candidatus Epulonipiscium fishelsonii]|uniref:Uncharacterized protein n=1 Tax=Candidatus Epulonipiscium fishelsonii TaxID=77094 RepID=A0ACC8XBN5_9FIRM|nr:hypothetical protein AN639_01390 [Epulopiscium sp. SCG-B05WGA-EpuloA1]ONI40017.1 hypothetical protein AN396_06615 [Epulopiscium sp. SCG-B11WGA-EpuloA1]
MVYRQRLKLTSIIFIITTFIIIGYISIFQLKNNIYQFERYEAGETIFEFDPIKTEYIGVNSEQIIQITNDGITAYDINGNEIWSDTLNLKEMRFSQKDPYFAIGSKGSKKITIFNKKGKQADILVQNPIVNFSINQSGRVAVIEEIEKGHTISAYDENGTFLNVQSGSFISSGTYPMSVEISPNNKFIMVSYIHVGGAVLESVVGAIAIDKPDIPTLDPMLYGNVEKENLVYEIEFISDEIWASIGDNFITFYDLLGNIIIQYDSAYTLFTPYLNKQSKAGGYLPVLMSENEDSVIRSEELNIMTPKEQLKIRMGFDRPVEFMYANDKGVMVGDGRKFKGYNKLGAQFFEYNAIGDVKKVIYDNKGTFVIAVKKDSVIRLNKKR